MNNLEAAAGHAVLTRADPLIHSMGGHGAQAHPDRQDRAGGRPPPRTPLNNP
jgi:hypothetical protein